MMAFQLRRLSGKPASLDLPERIFIGLSLLAVSIWVFPQSVAAQGLQVLSTPGLAFEIKQEKSNQDIPASDIPGTKMNILKEYLKEKNSPLQDYVELLLMQPNWKIVLAISHAESNMCRRQLGNNCWGIGGAKYHRFYPSFAEGIVDANTVLQRYMDRGANTPKKIMPAYVGWNNQSWVRASNQILAQIDELGI